MKVRCINASGWERVGQGLWGRLKVRLKKFWYGDPVGPKLNDICIVVDGGFLQGEEYYELLEYPEEEWIASCFEPYIEPEQAEEFDEITYSEIREKEKLSVN